MLLLFKSLDYCSKDCLKSNKDPELKQGDNGMIRFGSRAVCIMNYEPSKNWSSAIAGETLLAKNNGTT